MVSLIAKHARELVRLTSLARVRTWWIAPQRKRGHVPRTAIRVPAITRWSHARSIIRGGKFAPYLKIMTMRHLYAIPVARLKRDICMSAPVTPRSDATRRVVRGIKRIAQRAVMGLFKTTAQGKPLALTCQMKSARPATGSANTERLAPRRRATQGRIVKTARTEKWHAPTQIARMG